MTTDTLDQITPPPGHSGEAAYTQALADSYLSYACHVLVARALPDVRDGLKPVARRILYSAFDAGVLPGSAPRKSARIVGDVMGVYHPHGDASIYDAMIVMARPWTQSMPLIQGQGNIGNIDGDPPAAMRYTEARLSRCGELLVRGIRDDAVDFVSNYDGSTKEPVVLPAVLPNLLINGSMGIAVGMACKLPPHNPSEAVAAVALRIRQPDCGLEDIMQVMPGPDFPTGGSILGVSGILSAYAGGTGAIRLEAGRRMEGDTIIVNEIPYGANKTALVNSMIDAAAEMTDMVDDIRDESDANVRIVIKPAKGADPEIVWARLARKSGLRDTIHVNANVIHDGRPTRMGLLAMIDAYIAHRREVVRRQHMCVLGRQDAEFSLAVGMMLAVLRMDQIVSIIRGASTDDEAQAALLALEWQIDLLPEPISDFVRFLLERRNAGNPVPADTTGVMLDPAQVKAIMDMRLRKLVGMEQRDLAGKAQALVAAIRATLKVLTTPSVLDETIISQMEHEVSAVQVPRRTVLLPGGDDSDAEIIGTIPKEDVLVLMGDDGFIRRVPMAEIAAQGRGGKGRSATAAGRSWITTTHDFLLAITSAGQAYSLPVHRLPAGGLKDRGRSIVNYLPVTAGETLTACLPIPENGDDDLIFVFADGSVRRTPSSVFVKLRRDGKRAIPADGPALVAVLPATSGDDIIMFSSAGRVNRFPVADLSRVMSTASTGVAGLKIGEADSVISALIVPHDERGDADDGQEDDTGASGEVTGDQDEQDADRPVIGPVLTVVTTSGMGKRIDAGLVRLSRRAGKGRVYAAKDFTVFAVLPGEQGDLLLMTKGGRSLRSPMQDIRLIRNLHGKGVRLMRLDEGDTLATAVLAPTSEEEKENAA